MFTHAGNGGFPEPPNDELQRLVRVRHGECGAETRVRLPRALPARVVRRVVCDHCAATYDSDRVEEIGLLDAGEAIARAQAPAGPDAAAAEPPPPSHPAARFAALARPRLPHIPTPDIHSRGWRWASAAVAAVAVVAILLIVQGGDSGETSPDAGRLAGAPPAGAEIASSDARFVTEPGFSLALPPGWERTPAEGGAAFTASSVDGNADATLWIERAPALSLRDFEQRSLAQLESLAGNSRVLDRIAAPTVAGTVVQLGADVGGAPYVVTLRAAGPYRYYLSTSVTPGASREAVEGAELIHGSFVPEPDGSGAVAEGEAPGASPSPTEPESP
jgi:hypothetical protein